MHELDKFNEEMHGKSEEEKAQIIYGGDWRPEHSAITRPEPHVDPLEGEEPYPLRPYAKSFTARCPYCHYSDRDEGGAFFDAAQCICKE